TGIIDSHRFMLALRGDLEDRGGMIAFASPIERLKPSAGGGWDAALAGSEAQWLGFDAVINCAGLGAQRLARATEGYPAQRVPRSRVAGVGCSARRARGVAGPPLGAAGAAGGAGGSAPRSRRSGARGCGGRASWAGGLRCGPTRYASISTTPRSTPALRPRST